MPARLGQAAIGFANRVLNELVADGPAVEDRNTGTSGVGRASSGKPMMPVIRNSASRDLDGQPLVVKFLGPGREQSLLLRRRGQIERNFVHCGSA